MARRSARNIIGLVGVSIHTTRVVLSIRAAIAAGFPHDRPMFEPAGMSARSCAESTSTSAPVDQL